MCDCSVTHSADSIGPCMFWGGYLTFSKETSNACITINFDIDATLHTHTLNCMMFTEIAQEDNQLREKTIKSTEYRLTKQSGVQRKGPIPYFLYEAFS